MGVNSRVISTPPAGVCLESSKLWGNRKDPRGKAQELSPLGRWPTQGTGPQEPLGGGGDRGSKLGQAWEREEVGRILSPEGLRGVEKRWQ